MQLLYWIYCTIEGNWVCERWTLVLNEQENKERLHIVCGGWKKMKRNRVEMNNHTHTHNTIQSIFVNIPSFPCRITVYSFEIKFRWKMIGFEILWDLCVCVLNHLVLINAGVQLIRSMFFNIIWYRLSSNGNLFIECSMHAVIVPDFQSIIAVVFVLWCIWLLLLVFNEVLLVVVAELNWCWHVKYPN